MIDVDDVLLLRPLPSTAGFDPQPQRPAPGVQVPASVLVVTICSLDGPADVAVLDGALVPALAATASPALGVFIEESAENTFPALPVRTGEHVVVWVQRVRTTATADDESPDSPVGVSRQLARDLLPNLVAAPAQLRLEPTPRSGLR